MILFTNEKINLHTGQSFHDDEDLIKLTIEKKKTRNVNISANFMLPCFFHSATHYRFSMHCHSNTSPPKYLYLHKNKDLLWNQYVFKWNSKNDIIWTTHVLEWTKMNIGKITKFILWNVNLNQSIELLLQLLLVWISKRCQERQSKIASLKIKQT